MSFMFDRLFVFQVIYLIEITISHDLDNFSSWVASITKIPFSEQSLKSLNISSLFLSSKEAVGSSAKRNFAFLYKARAIPNLCFPPPIG